MSRCPSPSPLAGEGRGEGARVRDVLTLSCWLVPSCHSQRFNRCHSSLFLPVIPDVSTAVILACSFLSFPTFQPLSFPLVPSCHSQRFNRCHSRLFLLVIPNVSHPVIPDIINRESKGRGEGVPKGAGEARTSCEASTTEQKENPGFPLETCGNDKWGKRE